MGDLLFPNESKKEVPERIDAKEHIEDDIERTKKHVSLLEKEMQLEEMREKRLRKKNRKQSEASIRKNIRKRKAIAMRMRNIPIDVIANRLGISNKYALELVKEAVSELPEETAADLKKLLGRSVIQLIGKFENTALLGDAKHADVMLKAIEKLMKLAGLNIQKREVEQTNTNMDLGNVGSGIDVKDLNLDLETKRKILQAIRENKKLNEQLQQEKKNAAITEPVDDEDRDDEDEA